MEKTCSKCNMKKNVEEFSKDRSKSDGLTCACKRCNNNREKKRRENGGNFTRDQKKAISKRYGSFCQICESNKDLQVDHRLAQNLCKYNTASVEDNAWILCKVCNIAKGTKILIEVIREVTRDILGPMLLRDLATKIAKGYFKKVRVTIGGKQFTEVIIEN